MISYVLLCTETLSPPTSIAFLTGFRVQQDDSDNESGSDSEQDSVSEDESAVKPHRRSVRSALPAHSLTSQHSDDASQLGQHEHHLCKSQ